LAAAHLFFKIVSAYASSLASGLDPISMPKDLPDGGRNPIAIDLVRNFLEIANQDQRSALPKLVKKADRSSAVGGSRSSPQVIVRS